MLSDLIKVSGAISAKLCLNPCSNGICSLTKKLLWIQHLLRSLNPCSNGICSLTIRSWSKTQTNTSLNPCSNGICSLTDFLTGLQRQFPRVLILVLMEYALWQFVLNGLGDRQTSLNPCSNGICSLTKCKLHLIKLQMNSLNPCSNGICSLTATFVMLSGSES